MTKQVMGPNDSSSLTLFSLAACFYHTVALAYLLKMWSSWESHCPEPTTVLMIDHFPLDCGERKVRGVNKKEKEKGASRGVDNPTRSEWCVQAFVFSGEISGLRSHEGTCKVSGGLAGTDVLTQWTCTWLFAYSLKLKEMTSPFGNK